MEVTGTQYTGNENEWEINWTWQNRKHLVKDPGTLTQTYAYQHPQGLRNNKLSTNRWIIDNFTCDLTVLGLTACKVSFTNYIFLLLFLFTMQSWTEWNVLGLYFISYYLVFLCYTFSVFVLIFLSVLSIMFGTVAQFFTFWICTPSQWIANKKNKTAIFIHHHTTLDVQINGTTDWHAVSRPG